MPRTPSAAAEHVGANILELRKKRGPSQDDLTSKTGIDGTNIRPGESGRALIGL